MNTELPITNPLSSVNRLMRGHVGAVVLTATVAATLLFGFASIPTWVAVACCSVIATVAIAFVAAAVHHTRSGGTSTVPERVQILSVSLALALLQLIFVLPVLICVFAPTYRA